MNELSFEQRTRDDPPDPARLSANFRFTKVRYIEGGICVGTCNYRAEFHSIVREEGRRFGKRTNTAAPCRADGYGGVAISKNNGEPGSLFWEVGGGLLSGGQARPGRSIGQGTRYVYLRSWYPEYSVV